MKPDLIDLALIETTTLYALALEALNNKERFEPDGTWAEVAVGCALCLTAAGVRARTERDPWRVYLGVWRAFVIGGLPILMWQLWQAAKRNRALVRALTGFGRKGDDLNGETMAVQCRGDAARHNRECQECEEVAEDGG